MIQIDRDPLLGSYIFISDKKVKAESNRNRNCNFFASLGNPKGGTFFYASHICQNFLYKPISISMIQLNISEAINENSTIGFNRWDDFSSRHREAE